MIQFRLEIVFDIELILKAIHKLVIPKLGFLSTWIQNSHFEYEVHKNVGFKKNSN